MEGTNLIVLFIVGFVLGCTLVMLLWMASPGCIFSQQAGGEGSTAGTSANLTYPGGASSSMVIRDASGARTLATTGDRGTPSTFTDENGRERDVVCYTSYYCIDQTPCEEEECVQLSQRCGEWPSGTGTFTAATNMQGGTTDYGNCCDPYQCVDGYCGQEECAQTREKCTYDNDCCEGQCVNGICTQEECQQQNDMCGTVYPTQTATTAYNPNPVDYGDCCPPYECVDNRCGGEEEQCVETGQTCGTTYPTQTATAYNPNPVDHGDCCPPDECVNNVCTSEEPCVETGAMCGYGPATSATYTNVANRPWYGDCCTGDTCVDGYCQPQCADMGGKCSSVLACCDGYCVSGVCATCTPQGYDCESDSECCGGYACSDNGQCVPASACMKENAECGKDSDCCQGLVCFDGTCKPQGVCGEAGQTCGLGVDCCGDMECSDNDVCIECAQVGETCGGQYTGAGGLSCCSTGYCYLGVCQQKAGHLCTDTETGPDYYNEGSATGDYQGDYGTYTDYCGGTTASQLYEYYCEVPGDYSEVMLAILTCPNGCSGGACK